MELSYTLLADGSSDRGLLRILTWMIKRHLPNCAIRHRWADPRHLSPPASTLSKRIEEAVDLYPCDILFIHRDAERVSRATRAEEISRSLMTTKHKGMLHVFVIPVRMTEAWLLLDEGAIRKASGNPNGRVRLNLPRVKDLENLVDPKKDLWDLLLQACDLPGRRLKRFKAALSKCQHRLTQLIRDFSRLLELPAFQAMDDEFRQLAESKGWLSHPHATE